MCGNCLLTFYVVTKAETSEWLLNVCPLLDRWESIELDETIASLIIVWPDECLSVRGLVNWSNAISCTNMLHTKTHWPVRSWLAYCVVDLEHRWPEAAVTWSP